MDAQAGIKTTFRELLERKPYNEITIAEICRNAHVSSKTFYKYYEGKPGLVRALMYDDWAAPVLQVREVLPLDAIRSGTHLMVEQSFEKIWEQRVLYRNLFKYYGRTELTDDIVSVLEPLNRGIYEHYNLPEEEKDVVVYLFSYIHIPLVYWWITSHEHIPPKRMARYSCDWCFAHWKDLSEDGKL